MQPVLFDTFVYITALCQGNDAVLQTRNVAHASPLWLSAVVLEELYAGADARGRNRLTKIERDFVKVNRLLVPQASEWSRTGEVLARIGEKYGYEMIGKARMTNDTLISTSVARQGIMLLTINERDFRLIAKFCSLQYRLM